MGSSSSKERFERAATTGTLTINKSSTSSWTRLVKALRKLPKLRTLTVSETHITEPIPYTFIQLPLWGSLVFLDLANNGLRCACALGCATELPKSHVEDVEQRLNAHRSATKTTVSPLPLESLNLSANALHLLPPLLTVQFPRLRRLVCSHNAAPLTIPRSLATCLGPATKLEVLELQCNKLERVVLADDDGAAEEKKVQPLPALRELLLDGNCLSGTLTMELGDKEGALSAIPSLRRLSVESQAGQQPLKAVYPALFVHFPGLTSLSLRGNPHEDEIYMALGKSEVYRRWQEEKAGVIDKKIGAGGSAELMP